MEVKGSNILLEECTFGCELLGFAVTGNRVHLLSTGVVRDVTG